MLSKIYLELISNKYITNIKNSTNSIDVLPKLGSNTILPGIQWGDSLTYQIYQSLPLQNTTWHLRHRIPKGKVC